MEPLALPTAFDYDRDSATRAWKEIPEHLRPGLVRYFDDGIIPGSFLSAILCNDFQGVMRTAAPDIARIHLTALALLMACAPHNSCGSMDKVMRWSGGRHES